MTVRSVSLRFAARLLPIATLALAVFACARREEASGPSRLEWTMQDLQRSWSADSADTSREVWVSFHYPLFTASPGGPVAVDSLNAWVKQVLVASAQSDSTPGDLEALAGQMIANYQGVRRDFGTVSAPWFYENEVRVTWDSLGVISMISSADGYTGGAHGSAVRIWGVLDANTGRRLALGDLIAASARDTLERLGEAAFRGARRIPEGGALQRDGFWFENGRFRLAGNFGLDRDGLVFHYNSYEVAPYAMGPTTVVIPWDAVAGYLRPDGPLASLRP